MKGSTQPPWRPPPAGRARLGRYRLLAEIARGGIGAVYVGCADGPTGFRKLVAIKTLRPDVAAEPALVRMLVEEAQVASRLHHPHIAQLYDLGDDGGPFLVMEYVHGESLSAVLALAGALPARISVWIAAHICDALAYAHALRDERGAELGLVHRDVSPQNIPDRPTSTRPSTPSRPFAASGGQRTAQGARRRPGDRALLGDPGGPRPSWRLSCCSQGLG